MNIAGKLVERRNEALKEIAALGPMRRGSLTPQFVETVDKKGRRARRGPYTVYTFKDRGKTVSCRIRRRQDEALYRQQIKAFRQYQRLSAELIDISQRLADLAVSDQGDEKKLRGADRG